MRAPEPDSGASLFGIPRGPHVAMARSLAARHQSRENRKQVQCLGRSCVDLGPADRRAASATTLVGWGSCGRGDGTLTRILRPVSGSKMVRVITRDLPWEPGHPAPGRARRL